MLALTTLVGVAALAAAAAAQNEFTVSDDPANSLAVAIMQANNVPVTTTSTTITITSDITLVTQPGQYTGSQTLTIVGRCDDDDDDDDDNGGDDDDDDDDDDGDDDDDSRKRAVHDDDDDDDGDDDDDDDDDGNTKVCATVIGTADVTDDDDIGYQGDDDDDDDDDGTCTIKMAASGSVFDIDSATTAVTFRNLDIELGGVGTGGIDVGSSLAAGAYTLIVDNVEVSDCDGDSIYFTTDAGAPDVSVQLNDVQVNDNDVDANDNAAIYFEIDNANTLTVTIDDTEVNTSGTSAMALVDNRAGSTSFVVTDFQSSNSGATPALWYDAQAVRADTTTVTIERATIESCENNCVLLDFATPDQITINFNNNEVKDAGTHLLRVRGADAVTAATVTLNNNKMSTAGAEGIDFDLPGTATTNTYTYTMSKTSMADTGGDCYNVLNTNNDLAISLTQVSAVNCGDGGNSDYAFTLRADGDVDLDIDGVYVNGVENGDGIRAITFNNGMAGTIDVDITGAGVYVDNVEGFAIELEDEDGGAAITVDGSSKIVYGDDNGGGLRTNHNIIENP